MSTQQLWPSKHRANAQAIVDWLLSERKDNGWPVTLRLEIAFQELTYAADKKQQLDEGLATKILGEMYRAGETSITQFETRFADHRTEQHRRRNTESVVWRFYIPLPIRIHSDVTSPIQVKIIDTDFRLISFATLRKQVGARLARDIRSFRIVGDFLINRNTTNPNDLPRQFLTVRSTGLDWGEAWEQIEPAFNAFRGLLEFTLGYGGWSWSSHEKPRRKIPHPMWMVAVNERGEHEPVQFLAPPYNESKLYELQQRDYTTFKKNALFFKDRATGDETLYFLLVDCLRLYAQALDEENRHRCLLGLWQLAEAITQAESSGGKTETVVKRLAWLGKRLDLVESGYSFILTALAEKRNDIAHRGIHDVTDRDINTLKLACEVALTWLIEHSKKLPTIAHLNHFYSWYTRGDKDIKDVGMLTDTLKFIQEIRR